MRKIILTTALLATFAFNACQQNTKQQNTEITSADALQIANSDTVNTNFTDAKGQKLTLSFDNTKGTTTLNFNGETAELIAQKAASGIWYKNENYELRGKGNDIELKKDGKVVFTHTDDIVTSSVKNKEGQTLDMTFNNTANTAKVYLNDGEQIDLQGQTPASGIWYKNDHYELRGKGENLELTKDGKTIFKN